MAGQPKLVEQPVTISRADLIAERQRSLERQTAAFENRTPAQQRSVLGEVEVRLPPVSEEALLKRLKVKPPPRTKKEPTMARPTTAQRNHLEERIEAYLKDHPNDGYRVCHRALRTQMSEGGFRRYYDRVRERLGLDAPKKAAGLQEGEDRGSLPTDTTPGEAEPTAVATAAPLKSPAASGAGRSSAAGVRVPDDTFAEAIERIDEELARLYVRLDELQTAKTVLINLSQEVPAT